MLAQRLGGARDIEVFAEHFFLGHRVVDLHGRAIVTEPCSQRIERFLAIKPAGWQQTVAVRLVAKVEKLLQPLAVANATDRHTHPQTRIGSPGRQSISRRSPRTPSTALRPRTRRRSSRQT